MSQFHPTIWVGVALGALLALLTGCAPGLSNSLSERYVSVETPAAAGLWVKKSLPEVAQAIASGELSSEALVHAYIQRIAELDRSGPTLRSVLAVDPAAIERARELDELQARGTLVGPLHGVPIFLKDNIEARGRLPTTAGSTALAGNVTDRDAPLVRGLREAGAVILGKTNLSQWANFRSSASLSGWSAVGGQVRNPHILDRNPCGSSSGSGVAVAASLATAAVGTETNGSIVCPSTVNGIVGFKPTVGLVSAEHIVPISFTQDTAGPMTRSVAGAAIMLDAMSGRTDDQPFTRALQEANLSGVRLGVLRYSVGDHPGIQRRFEGALAILEASGAELVDINEAPAKPAQARSMARLILDVEFKHGLNRYLETSPAEIPVRSLTELIAYNRAAADSELALFGQDIFEQADRTLGLDDPDYLRAVETLTRASRKDGIDALLKQHEVRALVFPSGPLASPIDPVNGDVWPSWVGDGSTAAVAGYPHLSVPMGVVRGLPVGLSFVASKHQDAAVLGLGYAFEQAANLRVEPKFLKTAEQQPSVLKALSPAAPAQ